MSFKLIHEENNKKIYFCEELNIYFGNIIKDCFNFRNANLMSFFAVDMNLNWRLPSNEEWITLEKLGIRHLYNTENKLIWSSPVYDNSNFACFFNGDNGKINYLNRVNSLYVLCIANKE